MSVLRDAQEIVSENATGNGSCLYLSSMMCGLASIAEYHLICPETPITPALTKEARWRTDWSRSNSQSCLLHALDDFFLLIQVVQNDLILFQNRY